MTTYNSNIPQPTDLISNSQSQILGNFDQLNTQFAIDHTAFNTGSGNGDGYHKKTTLKQQGSDPAAIALANIVYTKAAGTGVNELYMRRATGDSSGIIQMTTGTPYSSSNANQAEVSTFLPGVPGSSGFIIKAGRVNKAGAGGSWTVGTVNFMTAFPNNCFSVTVTPVRGTSSLHSLYINNGSVGASSFGVRSDDNSWDLVYYIAMGN